MKHLFVSYEIALLLKKKGFNEECFGLFNSIKELCYPQLHYGEWKSFHDQEDKRWITNAPTHQQVIDWLDLRGIAIMRYFNTNIMKWQYIIIEKQTKSDSDNFDTESEAIKEALKLI